MRLTLLAVVAALAVTAPAGAAPARHRAAPKTATAPAAAPVIKAIMPAPLPPPVDTSGYKAVKPTRLATLADSKKGHDYAAQQAPALASYDGAPDRQKAWLLDHGLAVVEAPRGDLYLRQITDRLLACWPGPRPPIRIVITGETRPMARAFDAGVIHFSAPLLAGIASTDALAFTVAHELGHVIAEDAARRDKLADTITRLTNAAGSIAVLAQETQFRRSGNNFSIGMRSQFGSLNALTASYGMDALAQELLAPNLEAQQEFDADAFALDLLACAHFNPKAGADAAIIGLAAAEQGDTTHLERAARFAAQVVADAAVPLKAGDTLTKLKHDAVKMAMREMSSRMLKELAKLADKRKSPAARGKALKAYIQKVYGDLPALNAADTDPNLASVMDDPEWKAVVANAKVVGELRDAIGTVGLDGMDRLAAGQSASVQQPDAVALAAAAAGGEAKTKLLSLRGQLVPDTHVAEGYHVAGTLAAPGDDRAAARGYWLNGVKLTWATRRMIIDLAQDFVAAGDLVAAERALAIGRARMGDLPSFLPITLEIAVAKKKPAEAEVVAAKCLRSSIMLYVECVAPLGYDPACSPQTPEGKQALDAARGGVSMARTFSMPSLLDPETGQVQGHYLQCVSSSGSTNFSLPKPG